MDQVKRKGMDVASSHQHASQESTHQPTLEATSNPTLNESSHVGSDDNMESTTQTGSKRLKSDSKRVDRLSMLPDDILHHILSFLPTKQVVATSVLSKRWRLICTSVDYDILVSQRNNKPYLSFVKDVNKTILARDVQPSIHPPIRKFRLIYYHSYANVNAWVKALMRQCIESLEMDLFSKISLSCNIFCCKTLVVLKLTRLSLNDCSSIELPSLKSLHLVDIRFPRPQYFIELLYGLPILEDLNAHRICYVNPDNDSLPYFPFVSQCYTSHFTECSLEYCPGTKDSCSNLQNISCGIQLRYGP